MPPLLADFIYSRDCKLNLRKNIDTTGPPKPRYFTLLAFFERARRGMLFAKACYGMFLEKEKAMCHPYPTTVHKIEKWGYDGKQVHHMYRLLLMLRDFEKTGTMVLHPPEQEVQFLLIANGKIIFNPKSSYHRKVY